MRVVELLETVNLCAQKQATIVASTLMHIADYTRLSGEETNRCSEKEKICAQFTGKKNKATFEPDGF